MQRRFFKLCRGRCYFSIDPITFLFVFISSSLTVRDTMSSKEGRGGGRGQGGGKRRHHYSAAAAKVGGGSETQGL
jgi:hypothetical protein